MTKLEQVDASRDSIIQLAGEFIGFSPKDAAPIFVFSAEYRQVSEIITTVYRHIGKNDPDAGFLLGAINEAMGLRPDWHVHFDIFQDSQATTVVIYQSPFSEYPGFGKSPTFLAARNIISATLTADDGVIELNSQNMTIPKKMHFIDRDGSYFHRIITGYPQRVKQYIMYGLLAIAGVAWNMNLANQNSAVRRE